MAADDVEVAIPCRDGDVASTLDVAGMGDVIVRIAVRRGAAGADADAQADAAGVRGTLRATATASIANTSASALVSVVRAVRCLRC